LVVSAWRTGETVLAWAGEPSAGVRAGRAFESGESSSTVFLP
jgi:hypothetical protein